MKDILIAIVDSLERLGSDLSAIEGSLLGSGHINRSQMEVFKRVTSEDMRQKLSSLRSAIAVLPSDYMH